MDAQEPDGPLQVVTLGASRYPEVLAVLRAGFDTVREQFGITAQNNPHYPVYWTVGDVARAVARPARLLGVEVDSRVAGCAFVGPSRRREGCWELRHLAVDPEHRHRGLGRLLVTEAAAHAAADGAEALRIGIVAENRRLSDWYHGLGFVDVSCGESYPPLPFTVDHLELPLAAKVDMSI
ncbi:ribosomal protein S18 acetylase RimI-like enzyme [Propionicimonas paludicola]|uniref:Ribosomal protein S18 acetylase RimI-like enzyme n=1 Tax=Propionicimonas paludicola TaxID=185243 RepID=A0A2A9CX08_9ACTN|nr:GNAT family N-acetyltransferase [Propionicimonas paludicola]PFG18202.1 ribosomal protein S18 acetylase RimI-like enzyme [Propionicimonas paludicola]